MRQRADADPCGDDVGGPGPGSRDFELAAAGASGEAGGGVQDAVAQCLGLGACQGAVEGEQSQPGQQRCGGQRGSQPRGVEGEAVGGNRPMPQVLLMRMPSSTRAWNR